MVTKIREIIIELTIDTNHATYNYEYHITDENMGGKLIDIEEQINYWLREDGK